MKIIIVKHIMSYEDECDPNYKSGNIKLPYEIFCQLEQYIEWEDPEQIFIFDNPNSGVLYVKFSGYGGEFEELTTVMCVLKNDEKPINYKKIYVCSKMVVGICLS